MWANPLQAIAMPLRCGKPNHRDKDPKGLGPAAPHPKAFSGIATVEPDFL